MFIPGHITGFFKIYRCGNLLKTGSTGAGITVNKGVYTDIIKGSGEIYFNDNKIKLCPTIELVNLFRNHLKNNPNSKFKESEEFNYDIIHKSDFPLSCGLGTSGSCVLGASYEIGNLYNLTVEKILEFAHMSEVKCGTGLGDVIAQYTKGFVIRKKPGIPINVKRVELDVFCNVCSANTSKTPYDYEYNVVIEILGKKETSSIISNPAWINKINAISDKLLQKLLKNPTLSNFMNLSYEFAKNTGLASDEIISLCDDLSFTIGASQAMLGNTVFCICNNKNLNDVVSILNNPIVCRMYY